MKDLEDLVSAYAVIQGRMKEDRVSLNLLEFNIVAAMEDDGATVLDHPTQEVELKRAIVWDKTMLAPLRELVPPDALKGAYYPAHRETIDVPETWNMTKVKPLGKYGDEVKAVLEKAQLPGAPRLSIKEKAI